MIVTLKSNSIFFTLLVALPAYSGQQKFTDYFDALPVFWERVYAEGGETLYCGKRFGKRSGKSVNIEHVFPMAWVMNAEGCRSRYGCRDISLRFNIIESDMHNFYPARKHINKARGSFRFGVIEGERRRYGSCDFEVDEKRRVVEPRPASRGNIARAMFYMAETYDLKIFKKQAKLLKRWNKADPPDRDERQRNAIIEKIQGTRNRFIDRPSAADKLRF